MPLVVVPTPLGNLGDITLRALDTLRSCELIAAEDTRTARKLLALLGLAPKPTWSYREQNAAAVTSGILERARTSLVAVVSDAGMPGISDPGSALVAAAREAGIPVDVLPGACAFVTAAVLSGFPLTHLSFEGFVPRAKGERERALRAALASGRTTAWYEAPGRIAGTLTALDAIAPQTRVFVARELTKLHEQQISGTPAAVLASLPDPVRGEIALVIAGGRAAHERDVAASELDAAIDRAFAEGASVSGVARELSRSGFGTRGHVYERALARRAGAKGESKR